MAFPNAPDNSAEYFQRYFAMDSAAGFRSTLLRVRSRLREFCDGVISDYRLDEADVVGFTSMFSQGIPSIVLARMIKHRNHDVITVVGGANCEAPMGAVLAEHVPVLDYIFSEAGGGSAPTAHSVASVAWARGIARWPYEVKVPTARAEGHDPDRPHRTGHIDRGLAVITERRPQPEPIARGTVPAGPSSAHGPTCRIGAYADI